MAIHSVVLSGEPHGQKSLAGYGPQGQKELDMTETTEAPKHKLRNKYFRYTFSGVSQVAVVVKNLSANAGDIRDVGLIPGSGWLRNSSWASLKRESQPTSVFLPKESHGQRSRTGYSPQDHKQSDMTEATQLHSSNGQVKLYLMMEHSQEEPQTEMIHFVLFQDNC